MASGAKSNLAQLKQVNRGMNRSPTGRRVPCIPIDAVCLVQGKAKKEEFFHVSSTDPLEKKWKQCKFRNNLKNKKQNKTPS